MNNDDDSYDDGQKNISNEVRFELRAWRAHAQPVLHYTLQE
jgi:hypothetical protein